MNLDFTSNERPLPTKDLYDCGLLHFRFQKTIESEDNPKVFLGTPEDLAPAAFSMYFHFPEEKNTDKYDHCVFPGGACPERVTEGQEKDFPKPEFLQKIWVREPIAYSALIREYVPVSEKYNTLEEYLHKSEIFSGIDVNALDFQLVFAVRDGRHDIYLDVVSPDRELAFSIPVSPRMEKERELELIYTRREKTDMGKATKDFMDERILVNNNDGCTYEYEDEFER